VKPSTPAEIPDLYVLSRRKRTALASREWAGVGVAVATLAFIALLMPLPGVRLVGGLLVALTCPGWALMCWVNVDDLAAKLSLAIACSLTTFALLATGMIWLHVWHPQALLFTLAIGVLIACWVKLRPAFKAKPRTPRGTPGGQLEVDQ
jgi:hypothetical protein